MDDKKLYWAAKSGQELAKEVMKRVDNYYSFAKTNDVFDNFDRSFKAFYGKPFNSSTGDSNEILAEGDQGEYLKLSVNHYANFIRHQVNLVLSEKPAYKPVAATTNSEQESQAYQTQPMLESLQSKLDMDRHDRDWVLKAVMGGEAYKRLEWDAKAGYDYNGIPSGNVKVSILTCLDYIKDIHKRSQQDGKWGIVRNFRNKHELAATYPDQAEAILALSAKEGMEESDRALGVSDDERDEDDIAVFELLHERTPALPRGRYAVVVSEDLVLLDGVDLPYDSCHIYSLSAEDKVGTATGHSLVFDLLSIQEAINHLYSIVFTNQKTFGHQNILCPEDANISVEQVAGGLNFIKWRATMPGVKPEPLNLTATPAEIFSFIQQLEKVMETLSGVNSTVRGNAPANLESGSALALLESQSKSFASGLTQSFTNNSERAVTGLIQIIKRCAQVPMKLALAGEDNTFRVADLTAETFSFVDSVRAERVMSNSFAVKSEIGNTLLNGGHLNPNQYITFWNTGRLEAMTDAPMKERLAIKRNIEKWRRGEMVSEPVITENHALHIKEEAAVLFDDEFRANPDAVMSVTAHLQQHIMLLATPDPIMQNLLMVLGQQPLMLPPTPPVGGPNDKGSQPTPPGNPPSMAGPAGPELPSLPNNPSTGEQWNPVDGGGAVQTP